MSPFKWIVEAEFDRRVEVCALIYLFIYLLCEESQNEHLTKILKKYNTSFAAISSLKLIFLYFNETTREINWNLPWQLAPLLKAKQNCIIIMNVMKVIKNNPNTHVYDLLTFICVVKSLRFQDWKLQCISDN